MTWRNQVSIAILYMVIVDIFDTRISVRNNVQAYEQRYIYPAEAEDTEFVEWMLTNQVSALLIYN